jgi:beta-galactosidase
MRLLAASLLSILLTAASASAGAPMPRETVRFDAAWRFHLGDVTDGQSPTLQDADWRPLDVPHDWSIEGPPEGEAVVSLPHLEAVEGTWLYHKGDRRDYKDPTLDTKDWQSVKLPALWQPSEFPNHSYIWFRRTLKVPATLQGKPFLLLLGKIDDADVAYLNGHKIGATGRMPPHYHTAWETPRQYRVDPKLLRADGNNVLAVRVYNGDGAGGIYATVPEGYLTVEGPFNSISPAGAGGGYLDGGVAWYRKTFTLAAAAKEKHVRLDFDGVYMNSDVWINGQHLGNHPYGFTSFGYDLTPHLKWDGPNVLAVRVDVEQPCCRWYSGAGIYRHVWLTTTDPVHVARWGTYVTTPEIKPDAATVKVQSRILNESDKDADVQVDTSLVNGTESICGEKTRQHIAAGSNAIITADLGIPTPQLWSLEKPKLYTAVTRVFVGGRLVDEYTTPFGIRTISFIKGKGFFLNGKHVPLQGVCNHHDLGCLGSAINHRALERQVEIMKSMGCNAIRTSHNPPDPYLLDLCDRMGVLVMDEAFDEWKVNKTAHGYGPYFDKWSEPDLVSMIHRDRNHPCVILWSIGNEIPEQGNHDGAARARRLSDICHREDPTRPTTAACSDPGGGDRCGYAKALDVFGINYNIGAYAHFKDKYTLFASETVSALSTRDEYCLVPDAKGKPRVHGQWKNQVTSYDIVGPGWGSPAEPGLLAVRNSPWVAGEFVWTGFDYIGEPTPYGWPSRSSYFGIVDLSGFPKDRYYLYRSVWRPEPLVHLLPHWTWPEFAGQEIPVWCMSNCDSVELLLNGKSLGAKTLDPHKNLHVTWNVPYAPGTLKAVGTKAGKVVATDEIHTAGSPARLELKADRAKLAADGDDLSFVQVRVLDASGTVCPHDSRLVRFTLEGPGAIAGLDNGDPINHERFQGQKHTVFHGLGLAVVRTTKNAGVIKLKAEAEGLPAAEIQLETK